MRVVIKNRQSGNVFVAEAEFIGVFENEVNVETRSFSITAHVNGETAKRVKEFLLEGRKPPLVIVAEKVRWEYSGITVNRGTGWEE